MESYTLVFSNACKVEESLLHDIVRSRLPGIPHSNSNYTGPLLLPQKYLFAYVTPETTEDEEDVQWTVLSDAADICLPNISCDADKEDMYESLSSVLHQLAEDIPLMGCLVEVVWLLDAAVPPPLPQDCLDLYGVLKRMVAWNKAKVTMVITADENAMETDSVPDNQDITIATEAWMRLLQGTVAEQHISQPAASVRWRGSIKLVVAEGEKPLQLNGFEISDSDISENRISFSCSQKRGSKPPSQVLSSEIEVLAHVDVREIPLFYFTPNTYTLSLPSTSPGVAKSSKFLQTLYEHKQLGILIRLQYGSSWKLKVQPGKKKKEKERKSWEDLVIDNIGHILSYPYQCELQGTRGQYVFLLMAPPGDQSSTTHQQCSAHLLRRPHELRGAVVHKLAMGAFNPRPESSQSEHDHLHQLLSELPSFHGDSLLQTLLQVEAAQMRVIRAWIDEKESANQPTTIKASELSDLLSVTRETCLNKLLSSGQLPTSCPQNTSTTPVTPTKVAATDPYTCLEYQVLALQSREMSTLGQHKSSDSLGGLSPPQPGQVIKLNVKELLKFFNEDGTAAKDPTCSINLKPGANSQVMKCETGEVKSAPWPECAGYRYHDMYYSHSSSDETERRSIRLKSQLFNVESASICLEQCHSPATIMIAQHPPPAPVPKPVDPCTPSKVTPPRTPSRSRSRPVKHATTPRSLRKRKANKALSPGRNRPSSQRKRTPSVSRSRDRRNSASKATPTESKSSTDKRDSTESQESRQSRSQRHKRKLEEIVLSTLATEGVQKGDKIFKPCAARLYGLTKSFVKDLRTSVGLKQEMLKIAENHVKQVVQFERSR